MNNKIEKLGTKVDEIKNSLNDLKNNVSLSEEEKKKQAENLKSEAETTRKEIEKEIHELESKTDDESKKQKEEAETLLDSFNEIMALYASILNSQESEEGEDELQEEKKGFFKKTKEWVGKQWDDVWDKEKWKDEGGKNLLRTAGFAATGVGAGALIIKGIRKIFGRDYEKEISGYKDMSREKKREARKEYRKKKRKQRREKRKQGGGEKGKESGEKKGFWDRPLGKTIKGIGVGLGIGSGVYYVAHGLYTGNRAPRDMFDWSKEKKLSFDEAMDYCKGAIANEKGIEGVQYDMNLQYHEETSEIEAYGEKIKVNKNARKIEGLSISFKTYDHMINTAIIIAFLKKNYSGLCSTEAPFDLSGSWKGNINVNANGEKLTALDGTGNGGRISSVGGAAVLSIIAGIRSKNVKVGLSALTATGALGFIGGYAIDTDNPMSRHMPELDDEGGKKALTAYLNQLNCWKERNQTEQNITDSPIKQEVVDVMNEIQETSQDVLPNLGGKRKLDAIQDLNDEKKYIIKARDRDFVAEVTGDEGNRKIKILGISGGHPPIKVDMEKSGLSGLELPLKEGIFASCLIGNFLENYHHKGNKYPRFEYRSRAMGIRKGIYFSDKSLDTWVLSEEKFKGRVPTLFQEENRKKFLAFLNDGIKGRDNISIWKK